jgi:hypothetical protein
MESISYDILYKTQTPVSFITWLEAQEKVFKDYTLTFKEYQKYVSEWHKQRKNSNGEIQSSFVNLYVDLLNEIVLSYATEEEKRFLSNCNFDNPEELDIILPFFITKIKTICLYYYNKRENFRQKLQLFPIKGTNDSIQQAVRDAVLEEIETENAQIFLGSKFTLPALSSINENLTIKIEETYDDEDYYNQPTNADGIDINSKLYVDFKGAIIDAINQYPTFIKGLESLFSVNLELSGTELNLLKPRDFTDYIISDNVDDLKISLQKRLAAKYAGCDMYYLSTGSTAFDFVSGVLFNTNPLSGNTVLQLPNRRNPTIALVPTLSGLYGAYECGKFFIPSKTGLLQYNTAKKTYTVNRGRLKPNTVYIMPDPNVVGNAVDSTGQEDPNYPLVYEIDVSWNKISVQNGFRFGNIFSSSLDQLFYPYQSRFQDQFQDTTGISTPYDAVDFWEGEKDEIWKNSDVWPDLKTVERLPIDSRLETLLIDQGQMVKWFVDSFGNEYGLFKQNIQNIIDKKQLPGKLFVKTVNQTISSFNFLNRFALKKFPKAIIDEVNEPLNFAVFNETVLIETENYVVIDILNYDFERNTYTSSQYPGFYRKKYNINKDIEKFIGYFYRESNNSLFICFTTVSESLSASNYKSIIPNIFKLDIGQQKLIQVYPQNSNDNITRLYSLSSSNADISPEIDIRYIESGHFSHKEKYNLYNLSYIAYNLNGVPFFVNEKFYSTPYVDKFTTTNPVFFKPFMYVYDGNFSNPEANKELRFNSPYTDYAGHYTTNSFKFNFPDYQKRNVFAVGRIDPVLINKPGSYTLHFDWTDYNSANLFVGCSSFNIFNTENALIWTETGTILVDLDTWYTLIPSIQMDGRDFFVQGKVIGGTNGSIFEVYVGEQSILDDNGTLQPPFTGLFCDDPYSIFRTIKIEKVGTGKGIVTSDPFCIDCGNTCEFLYPLGSTIFFKASAGPGPQYIFTGWAGGNCDGVAGDCFVSVEDNLTLSAIFTEIPSYDLTISINISGVVVVDPNNNILCPGEGTCTYTFLEGTGISLSASPAPIGYRFAGFQGISYSDTQPNFASLSLRTATSLTAFYEPLFSSLYIENVYNKRTGGAVLIGLSAGTEGIYLLPSYQRDYDWYAEGGFARFSSNRGFSPGTVYTSLCPGYEIKNWVEIADLPTGTFNTLSATVAPPYEFEGWDGTPCEGRIVDNCSFAVREVRSISAFFTSPLMFFNVVHIPFTYTDTPRVSNLGYVNAYASDNTFYCQTYTKNQVCSNVLLSGTRFDIICKPYDGSMVHALYTTNGIFVSGTNTTGKDPNGLRIPDFVLTENSTLSVVSEAFEYRTLTVHKSSNSNVQFAQVLLTPGALNTPSSTVPSDSNKGVFIYPKSLPVEILPIGTTVYSKPLYTIGDESLLYPYTVTERSGLILEPNPSFFTQQEFQLFSQEGIVLNGSSAPFFSRVPPIFVNSGEALLNITENTSLTCVFVLPGRFDNIIGALGEPGT